MDSIYEFFKALIEVVSDTTKSTITSYGRALRGFAKKSIIIALVLTPLPIIGTLLYISWLNGIYVPFW